MHKYLNQLFDSYGIRTSAATPCTQELMEDEPEEAKSPPTNAKEYASVVMALYYVALRTRPDILFTVNYLSTRTSKCTVKDLKNAMRVLKYLYGTKHVALVLKPSGTKMHFYVDASYNIHLDTSRSQSGLVACMGGDTPSCGLDGAMVCKTSVQRFITVSSTEAEMAAVFENHQWFAFFSILLGELGFPQRAPMIVCQDNDASILNFTYGFRQRTKPLNLKYNYIRELVVDKVIVTVRVDTWRMVCDCLTKPFYSPTLHIPGLQRLLNDPNWYDLVSNEDPKLKMKTKSSGNSEKSDH
jgi:hypothetical protein